MAYGKKNTSDEECMLERVRDLSTLAAGKKYHLRKMVSREGNSVLDEVHDVIFKELKDGCLIEQDTDAQFQVGENEFEIFVRKKI